MGFPRDSKPGRSTSTSTCAETSGVRIERKHDESSRATSHSSDPKQNLPSEQDRKAVLGGLAAVLNVMCSPNRELTTKSCDPAGSQRDSISRRSATTSEGNHEATTSLDEDHPPKTGNDSRQARTEEDEIAMLSPDDPILARCQERTYCFQRNLLNLAAKLLMLDEKCAMSLIPTLTARTDDAQQTLIRPFLESLSNEEDAFRCVSLLLFRFLLVSSTGATTKGGKLEDEGMGIVGYDARARRAFKCLAVAVFLHFSPSKKCRSSTSTKTLVAPSGMKTDGDSASFSSTTSNCRNYRSGIEAESTLKFEALEDDIARKILSLSEMLQDEDTKISNTSANERGMSSRKKFFRGLKIGGAGVAAGALFAITGGMAAPAIAAGIAAVAGGTAVATASAIALSSTAVVTTVFGVGGGGLVASKVMRRTKGLGEFELHREADEEKSEQLSRTVCISGWLRDKYDFQRPWGVTPQDLTDKKELLARFLSVYSPDKVSQCSDILKQWSGKEDELWSALRTKYGKDPDCLLPLSGPRQHAALTFSETGMVNDVIAALGFPRPPQDASQSQQSISPKIRGSHSNGLTGGNEEQQQTMGRACHDSGMASSNLTEPSESLPVDGDGAKDSKHITKSNQISTHPNAHTAWDFHAEYGGELYTIKWESELLLKISNSVKDFARDVAQNATKEVLKKTAMATLLSAVLWPAGLLKAADMIDGPWTLAIERAEEAGIVLAHSLVASRAGNRPVSLVGFSFGALVIYSCLKELARLQESWEEQDEGLRKIRPNGKSRTAPAKETRCGNVKGVAKSATVDSLASSLQPQSLSDLREPASVVEDAILMGCPASAKVTSWAVCRSVVAGRLVNCYNPNDLMLRLMFRYKNMKSMMRMTSGTVPVNVPGVESYDVSRFVDWHSDYCFAARDILCIVGYGQPRYASMPS